MDFQINALPMDDFAPLFAMSDAELAERNAVRRIIDEHPGAPCRVSLADVPAGETVILVNHQHQPGESPYQSSHAIYVREGAQQARLGVNEVPEMIRARLMSVRGFDAGHMMIEADVVQGDDVAETLSAFFENERVAYVHLHIAKPGCFAASVNRA
jgi:hypothetical protein